MIDGRTELYGILGYPVAHSLSPAIYNAFFEAAGVNRVYVPLELAPENFDAVFRALKRLRFFGFNVTSPFKESVVPLLERLEGVAAEIGCVNTVSRQGDVWCGHNTDGDGLCSFLESLPGMQLGEEHVVLLGAGNAARAIFRALLDRKPRSVTVLNRRTSRFEEPFFQRYGSEPGVSYCGGEAAAYSESFARATLVVNATSYGLGGREETSRPAFPDLTKLRARAVVVDTNYAPDRGTPFLAEIPPGLQAHDGKGMLVHLARQAYRIWTGRWPADESVRRLVGLAPLP